jgi:hypothetical protein
MGGYEGTWRTVTTRDHHSSHEPLREMPTAESETLAARAGQGVTLVLSSLRAGNGHGSSFIHSFIILFPIYIRWCPGGSIAHGQGGNSRTHTKLQLSNT